MGRWSQRKRSGGSVPVQPTQMVSASVAASDTLNAVYNRDVDQGVFTAADYTSSPSNETGTNVSQVSPNELQIEFGGVVSADTTLEYNGSLPGVKSPDEVAIS